MRLRHYLLWETGQVGRGEQDLFVAQHFLQQVGATLAIEFAEDIVQQQHWLISCAGTHIGEFGQLCREGRGALLPTRAIGEHVDAIHQELQVVAVRP